MTKASKKLSRALSTGVVALVLAAAGRLSCPAHEGTDAHTHAGEQSTVATRNPNLSVGNTVIVYDDRVVVQQEQTFKKDFIKVLWDAIDDNKDGKISSDEKEKSSEKVKPYFLDYTSLRVNWYIHLPSALSAEIKDLPSKLPKKTEKAAPVHVRYIAVYAFAPTRMDLVELIVPNINAHEVTCQFAIETGIPGGRRRLDQIYRGNIGDVAMEGLRVLNMVQTDGRPGAFSAILSKAPAENTPAETQQTAPIQQPNPQGTTPNKKP